MKVGKTKLDGGSPEVGVLFRRSAQGQNPSPLLLPVASSSQQPVPSAQPGARGKHRLVFASLYLVMVLMFVRPGEVFPTVFGVLPLIKIATIVTIILYVFSKFRAGERLITWPLEMKMVALIWTLGLLLMPLAASPKDSFDVLFDPFIKTVIVFIMLINVVDTKKRLYSLLNILVVCQLLYALSAIKTYVEGGYGESASFFLRIQGWGTMFGNANDLASVLTVLLPFALIFGLMRRGWRRLFYFACVVVAAVAVVCTFSRSGFLGLLLSCGLILWKLSRGRRLTIFLATLALGGILAVAMPGKYMTRLSTILNPQTDSTNSAQERQAQMRRAAELAVRRPIIGIGMGNFHIYAIGEMKAHNSFLEIAAELGLAGLIAFLVLILAPLRSLQRIQRETRADGPRPERELFIISVCFQASLVAYIIYGFFASVEYLNFVYFGVAYAVAFRQIQAAEKSAAAGEAGAAAPVDASRGILWQSHGLLGKLGWSHEAKGSLET